MHYRKKVTIFFHFNHIFYKVIKRVMIEYNLVRQQ